MWDVLSGYKRPLYNRSNLRQLCKESKDIQNVNKNVEKENNETL